MRLPLHRLTATISVPRQGALVSRIRVAITTHLFPSEVTELSGPWLAEQADALGEHCDVTVLAALRECSSRDVVRTSGVHVAYRPTRVVGGSGRLALLTSATRYRATAMSHFRSLSPAPDLLHAHFGFPDAVIAAPVARKLGIPLVVTLHGDDAFSLLGRKDLLGLWMRHALASAAAIVCVSPAVEDATREAMGRRTRVLTIENGYDDCLFRVDEGVVRDGGILFAGTLTPVKNIDVLLRAFASLGTCETLTIAGDGPLRTALEQLAAELGVGSRVTFTGVLDRAKTARLMQRSRALAIPSKSEAWGMVAAEALACGTPVVASRVGGLPRIVASPDAGVLVEPGSVQALAGALRDVLSRSLDPTVVAASSGSGSWRARAADIVALYREVLGAG
jgi:glycosyltransferase involved in cell wall biosynthesis